MATNYKPFGNEKKSVLQINKENGKVIKKFESLSMATLEIRKENPNALCTHISECANGKIKSAYGYVWKFAK